MAKILTDKEIADIVRRAIHEPEIDDVHQYLEFLTDISEVITNHFGGDFSSVGYDPEEGYTIAIRHNEEVPDDGGIYKDYDKDVDWSDEENWD